MNQTTNYGFNVPVGSDIVNPLVQDFPNWETLDTLLRNIANTGITMATHTKSGTIHTLSFSDTTVPMIRFQATADFNTNDTFTVNGLSVSALTVAGESLPDGAFVIGSMVLCELRDNLLTVYTSGSDASTLEGHPASYFATASDLDTVDDKADANKVLIDQITIDLTVNSDTLTTTYASNIETGIVKKFGKVVDFELIFTVGTAIPMNTTFATMPSGYNPDLNKERFTCYDSTDKKPILLDIETTVELKFLDYGSNVPAGHVLQLSGVYVI